MREHVRIVFYGGVGRIKAIISGGATMTRQYTERP